LLIFQQYFNFLFFTSPCWLIVWAKTTILISHRPRIINRADWITVLNNASLELQSLVEDLRSGAAHASRSQPGDHRYRSYSILRESWNLVVIFIFSLLVLYSLSVFCSSLLIPLNYSHNDLRSCNIKS
jgi:hypothetical protein